MFKVLKDYGGVAVYIAIISLLIFGCMSLKTHTGGNNGIQKIRKELKLENKFKKGSANFVFLIKEGMPMFGEFCELVPGPCGPELMSTASGLVLKSDDSSIFVLTAAHFCDESKEPNLIFKENIYGFAGDEIRKLFVIDMDKENDICLLIGPKKTNDNFYNIKLADNFTIGEDVYTVAAPLGIGGPGNRLIFTGQLAGCNEEGCLTTVPATFGSSGAGIFNKKHELITIIMAVPEEFPHVIISPSNKNLTKFILDVDSEIDIYDY